MGTLWTFAGEGLLFLAGGHNEPPWENSVVTKWTVSRRRPTRGLFPSTTVTQPGAFPSIPT